MRRILAALAFLVNAAPIEAQVVSRPWADWRTVETPHFRVHYPTELETWAAPTIGRLESVHEAVTAFVGYTPTGRITILIDDPLNIPYGSAWPGDVIVLWPTPPDPAWGIERHRSWGEIVTIHELAHVAHLSRPSRNPRERFLWKLFPVPMQPILRKAPRWALEGYATLIEGRLTGQGRPHGAWRPAVLRQWALEGRLPAYERLSETEGFLQSRMAYLVGSAYLEWLVERSGEESLPHLWRRLSARQDRDFDEAFAGVFGGPPDDLYGRFKVEMTAKALAAEESLEAVGLVEGGLVQRLEGWTSDPAVSPDGTHLVVFRQPDQDEPGEIVVWTTASDTLTTEEREDRERARAKDPEDVPDVPWRPDPKRPVARLGPVGGQPYLAPRWLPDGEGILVVRYGGQGNGTLRPDLFEWRWHDERLRRVTRGAAIRHADPESGGRTAVGIRCLRGACDLVRVDLATGAVTLLAAGEPDGTTYANARALPDGGIVASLRIDDRWRVGLFSADGDFVRTIDPDDGAVRFGAAPLPGGEAVVAVSDRSGILDLERIELDGGGTRPLTRTTGASLAPVPDPAGDGIFFLSLTTHGYDLRRIHSDSADPGPLLGLHPDLAPVAPIPTVRAPEFSPAPVASERYGLGPRRHLALPLGHWAPEGWSAGAIVHGSDPVGRLGWSMSAMAGEESAWRGASAEAVWRGFRPELHAAAFAARHMPSEQSSDGSTRPVGLELELMGAALGIDLRHDFVSYGWALRAGGSAARLERPEIDAASRILGYAELEPALLHTRGKWRISGRMRFHVAAGSTADDGWARWLATARLAARRGGSELGVELIRGRTDAGSGGFERFAFGGVRTPLVPPEVLSQRLEEPAVPVGYAVGTWAEAIRLELVSGDITNYYRWLRGDGSKWKRVAGIEVGLDAPPIPFLRLPAMHAVIGLGRSLDEPFEDETRFYLAFRYRP
ncbi:MAG: hypothetical protein ABR527_06365 [Gemmatimonadota bacterium]